MAVVEVPLSEIRFWVDQPPAVFRPEDLDRYSTLARESTPLWQVLGPPCGRRTDEGGIEIVTGFNTYQLYCFLAKQNPGRYTSMGVVVLDVSDEKMAEFYLAGFPPVEALSELQRGYLWRFYCTHYGVSCRQIVALLQKRGGFAPKTAQVRDAILLAQMSPMLQRLFLRRQLTKHVALALTTFSHLPDLQKTLCKAVRTCKLSAPKVRKVLGCLAKMVEVGETEAVWELATPSGLEQAYAEWFPVVDEPIQQAPLLLTLADSLAQMEVPFSAIELEQPEATQVQCSFQHELSLPLINEAWAERLTNLRTIADEKKRLISSIELARTLCYSLCVTPDGQILSAARPLLAQRGIDSRQGLHTYLTTLNDKYLVVADILELLAARIDNPFALPTLHLLGVRSEKLSKPELKTPLPNITCSIQDEFEKTPTGYRGTIHLQGVEVAEHRFRPRDLQAIIQGISEQVLGAPNLLTRVKISGIPDALVTSLGLFQDGDDLYWYPQSLLDAGNAHPVKPGYVESRFPLTVGDVIIPPHERGRLVDFQVLDSGVAAATVHFAKGVWMGPPESLYMHGSDIAQIFEPTRVKVALVRPLKGALSRRVA